MKDIRPVPPKSLNPLARELLESMAGHPEAAEFVIGGGVALSHYLDYRETVDLDAWWKTEPRDEAAALAERFLTQMAARHGLACRRRQWGETLSLELVRGGSKVFSFQVSKRTRYLDAVLPAEWQPLWIETLRDNIGSKMTALTERGAPRDLRDIHQLCTQGIISAEQCWRLWREKNPQRDPQDGPGMVLFHVERLDMQRPLEKIQPLAERERAAALRQWYREVFCRTTGP